MEENENQSQASRELDKLLEKSAEMKARHQQTMEKVDALREQTEEFLDHQENKED